MEGTADVFLETSVEREVGSPSHRALRSASHRRKLHEVVAGEFIGEVALFLDDTQRTSSVEATSEVLRVTVIKKADISAFFDRVGPGKYNYTGARANAWCLLIHAEAYIFLSPGRYCPPQHQSHSEPSFIIPMESFDAARNVYQAFQPGPRGGGAGAGGGPPAAATAARCGARAQGSAGDYAGHGFVRTPDVDGKPPRARVRGGRD